MAEREGVIKYRLLHQHCPLPATIDTAALNAWRCLLYRLGLIGQRDDRYDGLGYGNISVRLHDGDMAFLISGTQTGHLEMLTGDDFAVVTAADPLRNHLESLGPSRPSSEALTHAGVYLRQPAANAVIHVHSPELWRNSTRLALPCTAAEIAYGTVEMALAVESLLDSGQLDAIGVFSMLGHEDGIVSFGGDLAMATQRLLLQLTRAIAIEPAAVAR